MFSELEDERAVAKDLQTELDIARALDQRSAGKMKYYMRVRVFHEGTTYRTYRSLFVYSDVCTRNKS